MKINHSDLINIIVYKTKKTKEEVAEFIDAFVDAIHEIDDDDYVIIRKLGKFYKRKLKPMNRFIGSKMVKVKEGSVLRFKASREKDR